jgi:uncharacterized protein
MHDRYFLRLALTFFSVTLLWSGCAPKKSTIDYEAYQAEIEAWHVKRVGDLKDTTGWLNLAGLFWLQEGINTFGSAEKNQVVFPTGTIAAEAGYFLVKNGTVKMEAKTEADVTVNGMPVTSIEIFHPDSSRAVTSVHGSLQWFVIRRDNQVGIRLRNLESNSVKEFKGIARYPVNPDWRVVADFTPTEGKTIDITNVLGQTVPQASPGVLKFQIEGKDYSIDALDGGKDEYFLIFGDPTNEKETYPSGRYLYVKKAGADGKVAVDFNKSYNPPCAFTPYATCPLAPRQNILSIAIEAGEKNYEGYSHTDH